MASKEITEVILGDGTVLEIRVWEDEKPGCIVEVWDVTAGKAEWGTGYRTVAREYAVINRIQALWNMGHTITSVARKEAA